MVAVRPARLLAALLTLTLVVGCAAGSGGDGPTDTPSPAHQPTPDWPATADEPDAHTTRRDEGNAAHDGEAPRHLAFEPAFYRQIIWEDPVAETVAFFSRGESNEVVVAVLHTVPRPDTTGSAPMNMRHAAFAGVNFGVEGELKSRAGIGMRLVEVWWNAPEWHDPENPPRTDARYVDDGHQWYIYELLVAPSVVVPDWADWVSVRGAKVSIRRVPGPNPVPLPDWLPEWAHTNPALTPDRVNPDGTFPHDGDVPPDDPAWDDE